MVWCEYNGTWSANPQWAFTTGTVGRPRSVVMQVLRSGSPVFDHWFYEGMNVAAGVTSSPYTVVGRTTTHPSVISIAQFYIFNGSTWSVASGVNWSNLGGAQYRNLSGLQHSLSFAYKHNKIPGPTGDVSKTASTSTFGTQGMFSFYQTLKIPT
jgi:hypothetical protein